MSSVGPFVGDFLEKSDVSNEKRDPGYLLYIEDYTTQLYGDYFINHDIRIPIKQPGFNGTKSSQVLAETGHFDQLQGILEEVETGQLPVFETR